MAHFAPSIHFTRRWLGMPQTVKQAFYDELDDIIDLLKSTMPVDEFSFYHSDFGRLIAERLDGTVSTPPSLVHRSIPEMLDDPLMPIEMLFVGDDELAAIEARLYEKLSNQLNEFLDAHFTQLSGDLDSWLKGSIRNEIIAIRLQNAGKSS